MTPDPTLPASRQPVVPDAPDEVADQSTKKVAAKAERSRSADEIERELRATTERLASNVEVLMARLSPRQVAADGLGRVRDRATTPSGSPRLEVIGGVVGALAGVALLVWRSKRR